jgi:CheY-like chemotaxis protein
MATAAQILQTAKTVDFMFDEFTRTARQQKLLAKFKGDMETHARIDAAWRTARDAKEEALEKLEQELLSTPVVDAILAELQSRRDDARQLLERIRTTQDILAAIEQVARLSKSMIDRIRTLTVG